MSRRAGSGLHWARENGQAHLRDTLAAALKDGGYSIAKACRETGLAYQPVYQGLRGLQWLKREDVEVLADLLDLDAEDIIGPSIFKDDPDVRKWNYNPGADPIIDEPNTRQARAICCGCGALRLAPLMDWQDDSQVGDISLYGPARDTSAPRLVRDLRCDQCHTITRHAFIETRDSLANRAEEIDHAPTHEEIARKELQELIDRLAELNVDVHYRTRGKKSRGKGYLCGYSFDDSKGRWRLEVDPNAPTTIQLGSLNDMWDRIAKGDHGDIDWDIRETGSVFTASASAWARAADQLVGDIERFINVERRRMVADLNDQINAQQGSTTDHDEESRA